MREAFKNVKRNRGAAGIDKLSIQMFETNLDENLKTLMCDLKTRDKFMPKPLRRVLIPKNKDKLRPLGIPAVRDRVAQEVLRQLLSPIFEPLFHENSFGFRPKRSCHMALERVLDLWHQDYKVVVDADIQGFFDNIPHSVIMASLANVVADGNILGLVERFLRAGVMLNGVFKPTTVGTPQGGVFSPLLANIALNSLDRMLEQQGMRFVRYADDFVLMCRSHTQPEEALALVRSHLENELTLKLSTEKTHIATFSQGFEYLGFKLCSRSIRMRNKSVENFKAKIREITKRFHNLDDDTFEQINRVVRGTANYFSIAFSHNRSLFRRLDQWIRMRLRCMKFKRKWITDNRRLRVKLFLRRKLLSLRDFYPQLE